MTRAIKKILFKGIFLTLLFIAGVVTTVLFLNLEVTDNKGDMNPPSLPEVMMEVDGKMLNRMYGYKQKMQVDFTRDSLTPVDLSQTITIVVDPHEQEIKSVSYEVRTSDGSTVLENKKLKNLEEVNGYYKVTTAIECLLRRSQEYSLSLALETAAGTYYYYTRVIQRSTTETVGAYLAFAGHFSETSVDKENAGELYNYLETEVSYADVNYGSVSIISEWDSITFGGMHPTITQRGVPILKEINETTGSAVMEYQISVQNEKGQLEYYDVTDFFRMRDTQLGVVLLDFKRDMEQVFDGTLPVATENGLILGIRNRDVNYMMSDDSAVVAFVQEGDLWTYMPEAEKFIRVFTFRKDKGSEVRDSRVKHDMKIIRVSSEGDVDFALYGYMNRGIHEGYSGISVCHYDSFENVVEEKVFIPCTQSFEFLKENMGILSYVNKSNQLFLLFAEKLYQVNVDDRTYQIMDEGIDVNNFFASETNAHAAWLVQDEIGRQQLKEIDFDSGRIRLIDPGDNQVLQILGFFNEDLIYGVALWDDVLLDIRGNKVLGMSMILIEDFNGKVKKIYQPDYLIINAKLNSTILEMELVEKNGSGYKVIRNENIMNSQKVASSAVEFQLASYERRGVLVIMAFTEDIGSKAPFVVYTKNRLTEQVEIPLDTRVPDNDLFYVYADGGLVGTYQNPAEAVKIASEKMGVVLNRNQQYIWERGNRKSSIFLTLDNCPKIFLKGSLDVKELQEGLGNTGKVLDLTGCSLDSILYMLSEQKLVIAKTGEKETRVLVGYDETTVWLYNPSDKETQAYDMEECEELFEKYGNIFVTYREAE